MPNECLERSVDFTHISTGKALRPQRGGWVLWSNVQGAHNGEARILAAVIIRAGAGVAGGS